MRERTVPPFLAAVASDWVGRREAARIAGLGLATFAVMGAEQIGPAFVKANGTCWYRASEVAKWALERIEIVGDVGVAFQPVAQVTR
jgi:hypothetical protein